LLAEHNKYGSLGFIMNKPMFLTLKDVVPNVHDLPLPVYYGGPVSQNQLFYVHTVGKQITGSVHIQQNYYWSGNFTEIVEGLKNKTILPGQIRFFIGYSGWGEGQLEQELSEKAWGQLDSHSAELINKHPDDIWPEQIARLGNNYQVFANVAQDPSMN
ncbi:MAG: YqgE/AlgH family protein, partial [Bacteroidia bacterium]